MVSESSKKYNQLTQESVWSELSMIFQKEKTKIVGKLDETKINTAFQGSSLQETFNICEFKTEIQNFTKNVQKQVQQKFSALVFKCKVSDIERNKVKAQSQEKIKKLNEQRQNQQKMIQTLSSEKKNLQILLKTYERVLSGSQNKTFFLNQNNQKYPVQTKISNISQKRKQNYHTLTIRKVYEIKIQSKQPQLYSSRQLSTSRLTSSRMSKLGTNSGALRDLQNNWNKSVNLTSKSFKSTKKQNDRSVQRDDNKFVKSHIKEKQLSRSSIKENIPKRQQTKPTYELDDSVISEFSIVKF